jgi:uncharacterized membrane protein YfcA
VTWGAAILVAVVAGGAAFNQAITGFGFSLVAVPLLSLATSASRAVVVVGLIGLPLTVVMAARHHDHVEWPAARTITLASLAGMPLGLVVLTVVSDSVLRIIIGVVVVVLATMIASGVRVTRGVRVVNLASGFIGGVLSTSTGTNGPPIVLGLRARRLSAQAFRSTISVVFAVSGAVSLILFAAAGRVDANALSRAAVGYPFLALGWFAGDRVAPRVNERVFSRLVVALLYASALSAIVSAVYRST